MQFTESISIMSKIGIQPPQWVVVIGANTGGPQALSQILPQFPADFPGTIIVVQTMRPGFTRVLADQLNHICKLPVHEPEDGEALHCSRILITPSTSKLLINNLGNTILPGYGVLLEEADSTPESPSSRIDSTMISAVEAFGDRTIGILLTGIGNDGRVGMRAISDAGGNTIAQDEASSAVFDLPSSAIDAGVVQKILPLWNIAENVNDIISGGTIHASAA